MSQNICYGGEGISRMEQKDLKYISGSLIMWLIFFLVFEIKVNQSNLLYQLQVKKKFKKHKKKGLPQ